MGKIQLAIQAVKGGMSVRAAANNYGLSEDELNEAITRELLPNKQPQTEVQEESLLSKAKNYIENKFNSFFNNVEVIQSQTVLTKEDLEKRATAQK